MSVNTPAKEGGSPVRESFLPFSVPYIGEEEKAEMLGALDSGWISTGPRSKRFEADLLEYTGARNALALSSCTAGLHLALVAADIGEGDEVVTSPLTFPSTVNVILHAGAKPVLADIEPDTFNVSPEKIAEKTTSKTKAIMPVHYGGQPCDMDAIMDIAEGKGLLVVEDAATAVGAKYKGRHVGGFEDRVTVFSFYANKVMTTGEGGVLLTGLDELASRARILHLHGMSRDAWKRYASAGSWFFEITEPGFKYNMTDMQAALGICQLKRLEWFIERRETICAMYDAAFTDMPEITRHAVSPDVRSARYLYPVLLNPERLKVSRDEFIEALKAENIGTSVHYIPITVHPYYSETLGLKRTDYPVTDSVFTRLISLPLFPGMADRDVEDVISAVRRLVDYYRK